MDSTQLAWIILVIVTLDTLPQRYTYISYILHSGTYFYFLLAGPIFYLFTFLSIRISFHRKQQACFFFQPARINSFFLFLFTPANQLSYYPFILSCLPSLFCYFSFLAYIRAVSIHPFLNKKHKVAGCGDTYWQLHAIRGSTDSQS